MLSALFVIAIEHLESQGPVAQGLEHRADNAEVVSSILTRPTAGWRSKVFSLAS